MFSERSCKHLVVVAVVLVGDVCLHLDHPHAWFSPSVLHKSLSQPQSLSTDKEKKIKQGEQIIGKVLNHK